MHQQRVFQLLQRGVLLAHLDKILLLTFGDIARGHVEVLGHQDVAQHVRRQHAGQIGLFIGRIPRLIELLLRVRKLLFRIFQLCFCGTQRHFTPSELVYRRHLALFQLGIGILCLFQVFLQRRLHAGNYSEARGNVGKLRLHLGQTRVRPQRRIAQLRQAFLCQRGKLFAAGQCARLRLEGFKRRVVQSQKRVHVGWNGGGGLFSHHRRVRQGRQARLSLLELRVNGGGFLISAHSGPAHLCQQGVHAVQHSLLRSSRSSLTSGVPRPRQSRIDAFIPLLCLGIAVSFGLERLLVGCKRGLLAQQRGKRGGGAVHLGAALGQLVQRRAFLAFQRGFALGQLRLAVRHLGLSLTQLALCVRQTGIHAGKDLIVQRVDLHLVERYGHLLLHKACGIYARNAVDALKGRHNGFVRKGGYLFHVHAVHIHAGHHHGQHIRADLHQHGGPHCIVHLARNEVHIGRKLDHSGIHVRSLFKFQDNDAGVFAGNRADVLNAARRPQHRFQRLCHRCFDFLRACAGIRCHYHDIRQLHGRQKVCRHARKRDNAQHKHQHYRHQHGIGFSYTELRKHVFPPKYARTRILLLLPGRDEFRPTGRSELFQYSTRGHDFNPAPRRRRGFYILFIPCAGTKSPPRISAGRATTFPFLLYCARYSSRHKPLSLILCACSEPT